MSKKHKPNRYAENPHPPGTYSAAYWDLFHAGDLLAATIRQQAKRDVAAVKRLAERLRP